MRKLLTCIGLLGLMAPAPSLAFATFPDNTLAFSNCTAKVKVIAARLRAGPSLESSVVGKRAMNEPLFVSKVIGKWVQVITDDEDTAYVAAYLLSFPYAELLEQWKKDSPSPTVGKKARVKWASVNFRQLPSVNGERLGRFTHGEEVAVLSKTAAWSFVEARSADGKSSCFGFIANRALAPPEIPDPVEWVAPLARLHAVPGALPSSETPSQYLARTAWSPQVFAAEFNAARRALASGQYLAAN